MKLVKRILVVLLVCALLAGAGAGGLYYMKKSSRKEAKVCAASNFIDDYYAQETRLEGYTATNVSQHVSIDEDMVIDQVFVQEGDPVSVGDTLITFDMTLAEMELNIARLTRQKQEQDLDKAYRRLNSLRNGGPIEDSDADSLGGLDALDGLSWTGPGGKVLASLLYPSILAVSFVEDMFGDGTVPQDPEGGFDSQEGFNSGNSRPLTPLPTLTPTPVLPPDTDFYDPYHTKGDSDLFDGQPKFAQELEGNTEPLEGTGTEEDPFIFLCSSREGYVRALGSFFNRMAGYSMDGSRIEKPGGYWYQLEFHMDDMVFDFQDRKQSCIGYYLMDGSLLESPVGIYSYLDFTLEGASTYDEEPGDMPSEPGGSLPTISRDEAIHNQLNRIKALQLDIQESDIEIEKLEKKVERKVITSKLEGTVSYVGDPLTAGAGEFITVKSREGFYVAGSVSEMMLDKMEEGTILICNSYDAGSFEARVLEVSEYPSESTYYYEGNPNASFYDYTAEIIDKDVELQDMSWLDVMVKTEAAEEGNFVLAKALIRQENGDYYVFVDRDGVLKKQFLETGGNVNGGYGVLILGGITPDDLIAFPYGDEAVEGSTTKQVSVDEFYGY